MDNKQKQRINQKVTIKISCFGKTSLHNGTIRDVRRSINAESTFDYLIEFSNGTTFWLDDFMIIFHDDVDSRVVLTKNIHDLLLDFISKHGTDGKRIFGLLLDFTDILKKEIAKGNNQVYQSMKDVIETRIKEEQ